MESLKKTLIHCPNRDIAKKVIFILKKLGYIKNGDYELSRNFLSKKNDDYWEVFGGNTYFSIVDGFFLHYDGKEKYAQYTIISGEDVIVEYNKEQYIKSLNEPKDKKVYYIGNKERGTEIIEALKKLGGNNLKNLKGLLSTNFYYIGEQNIIDCVFSEQSKWLIKQGFTEANLPEKIEPIETIEIGGIKYSKEEVENSLKDLKPIEEEIKSSKITKENIIDNLRIIIKDCDSIWVEKRYFYVNGTTESNCKGYMRNIAYVSKFIAQLVNIDYGRNKLYNTLMHIYELADLNKTNTMSYKRDAIKGICLRNIEYIKKYGIK